MSWGEAKWIVDNVGSNVGGGFVEYETPGNHTFTVPAGVTVISVTACGGGGGGNYGISDSISGSGSGGGGGAAVVGRKFAVTPGQTIAITVGTGGNYGNDGGNTIIGNLLTLGGGKAPIRNSVHGFYAAGLSGGDGGGNGGIGNLTGNGYRYSTQQSGQAGIRGCGGLAYSGFDSDGSKLGGGGGGSLGNGGNGSAKQTTSSSDPRPSATNGSRGGGGGGAASSSDYGPPGKGGDGYVYIGWGVCMD